MGGMKRGPRSKAPKIAYPLRPGEVAAMPYCQVMTLKHVAQALTAVEPFSPGGTMQTITRHMAINYTDTPPTAEDLESFFVEDQRSTGLPAVGEVTWESMPAEATHNGITSLVNVMHGRYEVELTDEVMDMITPTP